MSVVVTGDLNAKVRERAAKNVVGKFNIFENIFSL